MNKEESLALLAEGKEAWNKWANKMLVKKTKLEEDGQWQIDDVTKTATNQATKEWMSEAKVDFFGHSFEGKVRFIGFIFPYKVDFNKATFNGDDVSFDETTFSCGVVLFEETKFICNVWFDSATFSGGVKFRNATFGGLALFDNATFNSGAIFDHAIFKGDAHFQDATFSGGVWFLRVTFSVFAGFDSATFTGEAQFSGATFCRYAGFNQVNFKGNTNFSLVNFEGVTYFKSATFEKESSFEAIKGQSLFSFKGAEFHLVPDFNQAHFNEAPQFDDSDFSEALKYKQLNDKDNLSSRWRSLKRLAIQAHDHKSELFFFAEEIKSQRGKQDKAFPNLSKNNKLEWPGGTRYYLGYLYQFSSDFGRSVIWPLFWLLVLSVLSYNFYLKCSIEDKPTPTHGDPITQCDRSEAAIYLSARSALPILPASSYSEKINRSYECLYGKNSEGKANIPNVAVFLSITQTILSTILIFLSLLALRNHFRIK